MSRRFQPPPLRKEIDLTVDMRNGYDRAYTELLSMLCQKPSALIMVLARPDQARRVGYRIRMALRANLGVKGRMFGVYEMENGKEVMIKRKEVAR